MTRSEKTDLLDGVPTSTRMIDRLAVAHDASHYVRIPAAVATPRSADEVARLLRHASSNRLPITFRSGGTSLSGQATGRGVVVDVRRHFRRIEVADNGRTLIVQPGAVVRQVNNRLARFGRRFGPDPASEIACTIGGVIADNSSGMACGVAENAYHTLRAMTFILPSGTVIDTSAPDADARLADVEPVLHEGLARLRDRLRSRPDLVADLRRQHVRKNTMGYGLNALLDNDAPVDILAHLLVGSEGTLAFVAEATFDTVPTYPEVSTGLLIFDSLANATAVLPSLIADGLSTIELLDAGSLRVARAMPNCPEPIASLAVVAHAALLVEHRAMHAEELAAKVAGLERRIAGMRLAASAQLTADPAHRTALWKLRKGIYPAIAQARPAGTTALLEDVAVPVERLTETCERLTALMLAHGYDTPVIFGHARDGNVHFLVCEQFDEPASVERYRRFTEDLVDLVLEHGGTLKAEHGTGTVMAPFVRRQYGDDLYMIMQEIKQLVDPAGIMNPGVLISDDPEAHLKDLKVSPTVEDEVDRCVECGYCEPACPSRDLTLTPRERIVLRREIAAATARDDVALAYELEEAYGYEGVQTCAVDGMCATACPVGINTGDLVRRLRSTTRRGLERVAWNAAASRWRLTTFMAAFAMNVADRLPTRLVQVATDAARMALGADTVPRYSADLPRGGRRRGTDQAGPTDAEPVAVYFPSCVGSMFAPAARPGVESALRTLCERAGVAMRLPQGIRSMCCGTPWKSKGHLEGYGRMRDAVLPALTTASGAGALPIVSDGASCSEGLVVMAATSEVPLVITDLVVFAREVLLPRLEVVRRFGSIAVHPTCSTEHLGATAALVVLARAIADEVVVPESWGCCGFAGDRGMLHPELTESATAPEATELAGREFDAYVSANRTCEMALSRATATTYRHVVELLEEATRP